MYSIGEFAKRIGKTVQTLQNWDKKGTLKAYRTLTNRRYYTEEHYKQYIGLSYKNSGKTVAYCRVSSKNQKDDLKSQKDFISQFALNKGIAIDDWYEDTGSGLNMKRKMFNTLLLEVEKGLIDTLIIAHPDRLVRFGFEWFREFCERHNCKVLLINDEKLSPEEEIVQDIVTIMHVFSSRIYGLRKYKQNIKSEILTNG